MTTTWTPDSLYTQHIHTTLDCPAPLVKVLKVTATAATLFNHALRKKCCFLGLPGAHKRLACLFKACLQASDLSSFNADLRVRWVRVHRERWVALPCVQSTKHQTIHMINTGHSFAGALTMVTIQALKTWNWALAGLHAAIAVAVAVVFYAIEGNEGKDAVAAWRFTPLPSDDPETAWRYGMQAKELGQVRLAPLLILFLMITAAAHVFYAASPRYPAWVREGWNPGRWLEYAITATIMVIIIGFLDGTRSPDALLLLAAATAVTMAFGWLGERRGVKGARDGTTDGVEWTASLLLFLATWAALGYNFFSQVADASGEGENKPPSWLWAVFFSQLVFFGLFAGVRAWHAGQASLVDSFPRAELGYMVLSLSAKATLAGLVAGGLVA